MRLDLRRVATSTTLALAVGALVLGLGAALRWAEELGDELPQWLGLGARLAVVYGLAPMATGLILWALAFERWPAARPLIALAAAVPALVAWTLAFVWLQSGGALRPIDAAGAVSPWFDLVVQGATAASLAGAWWVRRGSTTR